MKIYKLFATEGNKVGYFSEETSSMTLSELSATWRKYKKDNRFIEEWGSVHFKVSDELNKWKHDADIIRHNIGLFIANEYSKNLLEKKFESLIQFLPVKNDDDTENNYYQMYPIMAIDVLDVEKSECSFMLDSNWISHVYKYVFYDNAEFLPIFKLRCNGHVDSFKVWVTDEFKKYVEENNITGFDFLEVYDSETCNSANETSEETKAPVSEITPHNSGNFTMGKQMIPMAHEDGIFAAGDLHSTGECLEVEYFCGMITNSANSYTVYDIDDCDMARDMEVTYSSGRLKSVYVNSGNAKVPVYMCFDFSSGSEPEGLSKAVNECVELCAAELLEELKNAQPPLGSLSQEYYYDGEQMDINLQDGSCNIYSIGNAASHMLRCICICAGEQYPGSSDFGFEIFGRILNSLHKKLSSEIPERFDVTDDFKLYEPEMYV